MNKLTLAPLRIIFNDMKTPILSMTALLPLIIILSGCATVPHGDKTTNIRDKVVIAAKELQTANKKSIFRVNGEYYNNDCSGFVMASWDKAGINMLKNMSYEKDDNGVKAIYNYLKSKNKLFTGSSKVRPGDLVFFNNTYDKNKNKKQDDPLTHVGLVISMDKYGTVIFLSKTSKGITEDSLNLRCPSEHQFDGRIENTFLRKKKFGDPSSTKYMTSELFAGFGTFE